MALYNYLTTLKLSFTQPHSSITKDMLNFGTSFQGNLFNLICRFNQVARGVLNMTNYYYMFVHQNQTLFKKDTTTSKCTAYHEANLPLKNFSDSNDLT